MLRFVNTRYAVIQASYWGAFGSLWAFIALILAHYGFTSSQIGIVTSCATLASVFLSPALSSFLDTHRRFENRHGAILLLSLAAAIGLLVWLLPPKQLLLLGICFALIGTLLSSTPPFENALAIDANRCGYSVVYGFCRGMFRFLRRGCSGSRLRAGKAQSDPSPSHFCRAARGRFICSRRLPSSRARALCTGGHLCPPRNARPAP